VTTHLSLWLRHLLQDERIESSASGEFCSEAMEDRFDVRAASENRQTYTCVAQTFDLDTPPYCGKHMAKDCWNFSKAYHKPWIKFLHARLRTLAWHSAKGNLGVLSIPMR
jgi:hypothetical protein